MCRCQLQLPNFLKPGTDALLNPAGFSFCGAHLPQWRNGVTGTFSPFLRLTASTSVNPPLPQRESWIAVALGSASADGRSGGGPSPSRTSASQGSSLTS